VTRTALAAWALCLAAPTLLAAALPNPSRVIRIEAREQPLDQFLQDVFSQIDVPVNCIPRPAGTGQWQLQRAGGQAAA
jgi:hypothetical protein